MLSQSPILPPSLEDTTGLIPEARDWRLLVLAELYRQLMGTQRKPQPWSGGGGGGATLPSGHKGMPVCTKPIGGGGTCVGILSPF